MIFIQNQQHIEKPTELIMKLTSLIINYLKPLKINIFFDHIPLSLEDVFTYDTFLGLILIEQEDNIQKLINNINYKNKIINKNSSNEKFIELVFKEITHRKSYTGFSVDFDTNLNEYEQHKFLLNLTEYILTSKKFFMKDNMINFYYFYYHKMKILDKSFKDWKESVSDIRENDMNEDIKDIDINLNCDNNKLITSP